MMVKFPVDGYTKSRMQIPFGVVASVRIISAWKNMSWHHQLTLMTSQFSCRKFNVETATKTTNLSCQDHVLSPIWHLAPTWITQIWWQVVSCTSPFPYSNKKSLKSLNLQFFFYSAMASMASMASKASIQSYSSWLVVSTPLKNMTSSIGMIIPNIWKHWKNQINNAPVTTNQTLFPS